MESIVDFLKKFCSFDRDREHLCQPFSMGGFSFATNGHIIVRIPRVDVVAENPVAIERLKRSIDELFPENFHPKDHAFVPVEKFKAKKEACSECKAYGQVVECLECEGEGGLDFESARGREYNVVCGECNGEGYLTVNEAYFLDESYKKHTHKTCFKCDGLKSVYGVTGIMFGGSKISEKYVEWISNLPDPKLQPANPECAVYFKFDGGDGFVMPLRS